MIYRNVASRGAQCLCLHLSRPFHSSSALRDNHYNTLNIRTDATAKEIKSSFYKLSKLSHPDRNPNDPAAAKRFIKISEAHSILRHPEKRHSYDRDVLNIHKPLTTHGSHVSGPAGGRPASGLSRRRSTFRGPPTSFYRSGGWGEHSAKRKAAQEGTYGATGGGATAAAPGASGLGYGQTLYGNARDVSHFDRASHMRTHNNHEQRRKDKYKGTVMEHAMPSGTMLGSFLLISGLITTFILGPMWLLNHFGKQNVRKDFERPKGERVTNKMPKPRETGHL